MHRFADRHRGLIALSGREVARVTKLWTQTIAAPVLSSALFILVFGLSIGGRIKQIEGFEYKVFIVPGLITMAMAQAAYANNSATVFQSRFDRYINDVLSAPMASTRTAPPMFRPRLTSPDRMGADRTSLMYRSKRDWNTVAELFA